MNFTNNKHKRELGATTELLPESLYGVVIKSRSQVPTRICLSDNQRQSPPEIDIKKKEKNYMNEMLLKVSHLFGFSVTFIPRLPSQYSFRLALK